MTPLEYYAEEREVRKNAIELCEVLVKLEKNTNFKKLLKHINEELPASMAKSYGSPANSEQVNKSISSVLATISGFRTILSSIHQKAEAASKEIEEINQLEAEYLASDAVE